MTVEHTDVTLIRAGTIAVDTDLVQVAIAGTPEHRLDGAPRLSVLAAVTRVIETFSATWTASSARILANHGADRPAQHTTLFRPEHGREMIVVGGGTLAAVVRGLFPCQGWQVRPEPAPGTDLGTIREALGPRLHNMLAREGITTVEDLAAIPDVGLLDIRAMGTASIERIRAAVAIHDPTPAGPADPVTLTPSQVREVRTLLRVLAGVSHARGDNPTEVRADAMLAVLDTSGTTGLER